VTSDQEQREAAPVPRDPERSDWAHPYQPPYGPPYAPPYAPPPRPPHRPGRRVHPAVAGLLVVVVLLCGIVLVTPGDNLRILRHLTGLGFVDTGSYEFMETQSGTGEPVGYNPCRPIRVTVNPEGAPSNYDELVDTAMQRTGAATGLRFVRVEDTTDDDYERRFPRQPVLVGWATPSAVPELSGDVIGVGGSIPLRRNGRLEYTTGIIALDRLEFASLGPGEQELQQAVLDHEFGHLVGLDHVDDAGELMNEENLGQTSYGAGDREGLRLLGEIGC
jgi:hypothetical protein